MNKKYLNNIIFGQKYDIVTKPIKLSSFNDLVYGTYTWNHNDTMNESTRSAISDYKLLKKKCIKSIQKHILDKITMEELTINDLKLIQKYNDLIYNEVNYKPLEKYYSTIITNNKGYNLIKKPQTNYDHFYNEDFTFINCECLVAYLNDKYNLDINYNDIMNTVYKYSVLIHDLKLHYNRPRPFQTSAYLKIPIKHFTTWAGQTPSLPHGHSIQSHIFGLTLYNQINRLINDIDLALLINVCFSIGHRRIICGVHYPSDMVASYLIFKVLVVHLNIPNGNKYVKLIKHKIKHYFD